MPTLLDQILDECRRNAREAAAQAASLARITATQEAMAADIADACARVGELHKAIDGNGEGIKSRLARVEQRIEDRAGDAPVTAARVTSRANVQAALVGAGAAVIASLFALLVQFVL